MMRYILISLLVLFNASYVFANKKSSFVKIKGVKIFKKEKKVEIQGSVCLDFGILEYLLVAKDGRSYESIFITDCLPSYLHAALLLIGAKKGELQDKFKGDKKGEKKNRKREKKKKTGSRFDIFISWKQKGKEKHIRAEKFLLDRNTKKPLKNANWVFTGSYFNKNLKGKEVYLADIEKSVVAVWYDGTALFNLPLISKNPYRGENYGFEVNKNIIPKLGTKVKIIFKLVSGKQ